VTLRTRLTVAFLAVVLGPVLLGAGFVAATVGAVSNGRSGERLDLAATGVRTAMNSLCQRLRTAAEAAAVLGGNLDPAAAQRVVNRQLAGAVQLVDATGADVYTAGTLPAKPWADCSDSAGAAASFAAPFAVAARVEVVDGDGHPLGYAYAVEPVDTALVRRLDGVAGAAVTVLGGDGGWSTERERDRGQVTRVAEALHAGAVGETDSGRRVRRIDRGPGQPLPLAVSVSHEQPRGLYAVLVAVVVLTGLLSVTAAWWLARSTARPLTELSHAVDRLARGDLGVRVPVRTGDEVGRLGATFNRMAREMQGYLQALTTSRDQLRGHLGLLGNTLSSTHDVNRILEVILESALSATGARAGVLLLVDAESGVLIGQCAEGLNGRGPGGALLAVGDLRVREGEGLLGSVAASGEARRGLADRDGPRLAVNEPRCRTYLAVPFVGHGPSAAAGPTGGLGSAAAATTPDAECPAPARGVLALYDRHGFDEFGDDDMVTLRTFAGQAAIALDNVRVHQEAQRLSLTDPLTGLSNYRYLKDSLRREVERASRFSHQLTVLALDLDKFKEVNDTYGHAAGDAVLAEFARRVRVEIREVDLAFRQGGEEFVVLLPETEAVGGTVVAERLSAAIRRTPVLVRSERSAQAVRIPVTVSVGIAVFPDHGATGAAVLEAADDALYQAKSDGRDTFRVAWTRGGGAAGVAGGGTGPDTGDVAVGGGDAVAVMSSGAPDVPQAPRQSHDG
jgi:two-component system cell cycle response regulator